MNDRRFGSGSKRRDSTSKRTDAGRQFKSNEYNCSRHYSNCNPFAPICITEFNVPSHLMGLAIGGRGMNIRNAKNLPNIISIDVDDDCIFTVKATTQDACEEARRMLEYVEKALDVPRDLVSRCIGKSGSNIHDIVDKSGLIKIKVIGDRQSDDYSETVPFVFTGTNEAVLNGQMLLEAFITQLQEGDKEKVRSDHYHQPREHRY